MHHPKQCGEQSHWALQCQKVIPHDPTWLAKQQCYSCGQTGHLKSDCPLKAIISKERHGENNTSSSTTRGKCNTNKDPLTIQLLRLPEISLQSHPKIITLLQRMQKAKVISQRDITSKAQRHGGMQEEEK